MASGAVIRRQDAIDKQREELCQDRKAVDKNTQRKNAVRVPWRIYERNAMRLIQLSVNNYKALRIQLFPYVGCLIGE